METIKRTSKHILKYSNKEKIVYLDKLFKDYKELLTEYIDLLVRKELPLKALLTSTLLPSSTSIAHSQWKQLIYKQASEIVRSTIDRNNKIRFKRYKKVYAYFVSKNRMPKFTEKKYSELNLNQRFYVKPDISKVSINIDERLVDIQDGASFDNFLRIKLPYFQECKKRAISIKLPIKQHKQSLKYKDWTRKKTIQLEKMGNSYYCNFFYENEVPEIKGKGISIGIDVGYKKLLVTSREEYLGKDLQPLYSKIANAKRGSKNYLKLLKQRDNLLKESINKLDLKDVKTIFVEDLKGLKASTFNKENKKTTKGFRNKSQYTLYTKVSEILENKCKEQGVQIVKVSPEYTSQTCSRCKIIDKTNRHGEVYICKSCGLEIDADYNAAINILNRGVYSPSSTGKQIICNYIPLYLQLFKFLEIF